MNPTELYAKLQINPNNLAVYRKLAEYYKSIGKLNETEAFLEIIRRRLDDGHPYDHSEPETTGSSGD